MPSKIDAVIVSWPGKHENAETLAQGLIGHVDSLIVLYSEKDGGLRTGTGTWRQFPDEWYFGKQFRKMIDDFDGDILLHVMADVSCDDWGFLVERLRDAFERLPDLGIWSPKVDFSHHLIDRISLGPLFRPGVHAVTHTDETVWAMSRDVVAHMRRYDYDGNNLGWGIDVAAASYCHSAGRFVLIDTQVAVHHPKSTAYDSSAARRQMQAFFRQLPLRQRPYVLFLARQLKRHPKLRRFVYWMSRSRRLRSIAASHRVPH